MTNFDSFDKQKQLLNMYKSLGSIDEIKYLIDYCERLQEEIKGIKEEINVGDIVQLKSGGPVMTIEKLGNEKAKVTWFVGEGYKNTETFSVEGLTKIKALEEK